MINTEPKIVEKEKIIAEKLNGRFAMLGFVALVGAYLTTGQIIPGFIQGLLYSIKIAELKFRFFYVLYLFKFEINYQSCRYKIILFSH